MKLTRPSELSLYGRVNFISLKEYYKGVGANAKSILTSERDLQYIYYSGDNPPHMLWDRFEVRITNASDAIDKDAGRQFHTYEMKLRLLNSEVKVEFFVAMKTNIEIWMNMVPMAMAYASALVSYRNTVNQKFQIQPLRIQERAE